MGTDCDLRSRRRFGVRPLQHGVAVLAIVVLSGCTGYEAVRGRAIEAATATADRVLEDGIQLSCSAATAGALRRRWGGSPEAIQAWKAFCDIALQSVAP